MCLPQTWTLKMHTRLQMLFFIYHNIKYWKHVFLIIWAAKNQRPQIAHLQLVIENISRRDSSVASTLVCPVDDFFFCFIRSLSYQCKFEKLTTTPMLTQSKLGTRKMSWEIKDIWLMSDHVAQQEPKSLHNTVANTRYILQLLTKTIWLFH